MNPGIFAVSALTSGTCIESGDKLYGDFNVGNLPTTTLLTFAVRPTTNSITFVAPFALNTTYNFGYEVAVINSSNFISQVSAGITQSVGTSSLLMTLTPAGTGMINFTQTGPSPSGTSLSTFTFAQHVTDLMVNVSFAKGPDSDTTTLLNTFQQTVVPEPSSILLFGSGLLGLAGFGRRFLKI